MLSIVQKSQLEALISCQYDMCKYAERVMPGLTEHILQIVGDCGVSEQSVSPAFVEILLCLLTQPDAKLANPIVEFKNREKCGDFEPLRPDENSDALSPCREPLSDDEFMARKKSAIREAQLWEGRAEITFRELLQNCLYRAE